MIVLYVAGSRGESVVKAVFDAAPANMALAVVVGHDPGSLDDRRDAIRDLGETYSVPVWTRDNYAPPDDAWRILVGWRHLVVPTPKTIVFHDGPLPRYRGFSPVVAQLIEGEPTLGVAAFFATERYDEGDIITRRSIPIEHPMTIKDAFWIVGDMYADMAREVVGHIMNGDVPRAPQDHASATYAPWRDDCDYYLDWRLDSGRLLRSVYALGWPYGGAKVEMRTANTRIFDRVHNAEAMPDVRFEGARPVGKILRMDGRMPVVVCGTGVLRLDLGDAFPSYFRTRFIVPEECI